MGIKKLDELQLIKRGNIFKHCYFAIIFLLFANLTMLELHIAIMSQKNMMMCIIQLTIAMFCIEMIWHDIYPLGEARMRLLFYLYGLVGLVYASISVYDIAIKEGTLTESGMLSITGVGFLMGALSLSVVVAYMFRRIYNHRRREDDPDSD